LVAQDSMVKNNRSLSTAMERLSTGSRINTAADDAAGLSITTRMAAQVRGLSQAIRNANDGISIVQTAEGALDEVTSMLQRIRELSVQSVNASNNADDRASIDAEVQQLKTEIDRVATTTQWNNMNLLDGSWKDKVLQIGDKAGQTMSFNVRSVKTEALGLGGSAAGPDTLISTRVGLELATTWAEGDIVINGVNLKAKTASDDLADVVAGINERVDNVQASAFNVVVAKEKGTGVTTSSNLLKIEVIAPNNTSATTFTISTSNAMEELVANINNEVGGLVQASINDDGKLVLSNDTGATIVAYETGGTAGSYTGGSGLVRGATAAQTGASFAGFLKLESKDGNPIRVERGNMSLTSPGTVADLAALGLRETTRLNPADAYTVTGAALTAVTTAWGKGDITINGQEIFDPTIETTSFQGKLDAINRFSDVTGVSARAYFERVIDTTATFTGTAETEFKATDKVILNGVAVNLGADVATLAANINAVRTQTGIEASVNGKNLILKGNVQALTLDTSKSDLAANQEGTNTYLQLADKVYGTIAAADQTNAAIQLDSASNKPIAIQLGDDSTVAEHGFLEANIGAQDFDVNKATFNPIFGAALSGLNVLTASSASSSITTVDRAIQEVSSMRSELGAVENRLEKTVNNLSNVVTNTAQSRSRIKDTDYAVETTNLAKAQIIQQAATAMLAQANQQPQSVLALLQ